MTFSSREEAGRELGCDLLKRGLQPDIILGLPRGGVVVAAEVARILQRPLDVLVVRKIGHPHHREFALGALAEHGVVLLDNPAMRDSHVTRVDLDEVIAEESSRLRDHQAKFRHDSHQILANKTILIVDDGLATGATTEAAVMSVKSQSPRQVIVAVPVASPQAIDRLAAVADQVIALVVDPDFIAVGRYYDHFPQTADEEVLALLHSHTS